MGIRSLGRALSARWRPAKRFQVTRTTPCRPAPPKLVRVPNYTGGIRD
ncbi:hypothetical protein NCCP2716_20350 [Sporosarcina sp. NCCP-2716]|nr:hypothetical protein NCCP2716_20350 [Sporosarcina sp. NCCP-2716]